MSNELSENNLNRFLATSTGDEVSTRTGNDLEGNPLLPIAGEVIDSPWGQSTVERLIPRYSTAAVRDASLLTPEQGQLCYVLDDDQVQMWDGSSWVEIPNLVSLIDVLAGWLNRSNNGSANAMATALRMGTHQIREVADPTLATDAVPRGYGDLRYLRLATGGIVEGGVTLDAGAVSAPFAIERETSSGNITFRLVVSDAGIQSGYARLEHQDAATVDAHIEMGFGEVRIKGFGGTARLGLHRDGAPHRWRWAITSGGDLVLQASTTADGDTWNTVDTWSAP